MQRSRKNSDITATCAATGARTCRMSSFCGSDLSGGEGTLQADYNIRTRLFQANLETRKPKQLNCFGVFDAFNPKITLVC